MTKLINSMQFKKSIDFYSKKFDELLEKDIELSEFDKQFITISNKYRYWTKSNNFYSKESKYVLILEGVADLYFYSKLISVSKLNDNNYSFLLTNGQDQPRIKEINKIIEENDNSIFISINDNDDSGNDIKNKLSQKIRKYTISDIDKRAFDLESLLINLKVLSPSSSYWVCNKLNKSYYIDRTETITIEEVYKFIEHIKTNYSYMSKNEIEQANFNKLIDYKVKVIEKFYGVYHTKKNRYSTGTKQTVNTFFANNITAVIRIIGENDIYKDLIKTNLVFESLNKYDIKGNNFIEKLINKLKLD